MKKDKAELFGGDWTKGAFAEEEAGLFVLQQDLTRPFWQFFTNLTLILFVLFCLYDVLTTGYHGVNSLLAYYLPGLILYLAMVIYAHIHKRVNLTVIHLLVTLVVIIPLIYLAIISPEGIGAHYFFISIVLITIYYIVPGKGITPALILAILLSLMLFVTLLVQRGSLGEKELLNLLFFILINLAGLMLTYMTHSLLIRITKMSDSLAEKSTRLARVREEFINTLSGLKLGVLLFDRKKRVVISNDSFSRISGLNELDEGSDMQTILSVDQGIISHYYWEKILNGIELGEELSSIRGDHDIWLYLKGIRLTGELLEDFYLLVLEDITEQRMSKFAHDQSARHLRTVFNQHSNIVLYERQGKGLYFSDNVLHLTGYTSQELCKRKPLYENIVEKDDRWIIRRKYKRWLQGGRSGILYLWYRIKRRDGELVWIEERMTLLQSGNGDDIITGILIDNSELKETEQNLKQSEASLSKAQEIAHLGSWSLDLEEHDFRMSAELNRLLGVEGENRGEWQNFEEIIHPNDRMDVKRKIEKLLREKLDKLSFEIQIVTATGKEKSVYLETELEWKAEELIRVQGTVMDITQRKELERQLIQNQKMEAIGTLAGGIAHDFNNILNIIMGYTTVIEDMLPNDSELWYKFDRIMAAARRARSLVSHILTISRQHTPKREPIKLKKLLVEHLELLRAAIPSIIEIIPDLRSQNMVFGDPDQLEQIVMNLCTNAYYAMQPKGGKLHVRLYDVEDRICLEVEDNGEGIPVEVLEKIYDPYFTTKPKGEGTGLGLAIVNGIVDELEGEIKVESQRGVGSKFRIYIPKYTGEDIKVEKEEEKKAFEEVQQNKLKVLFLDDETDLLDLFTSYLDMNNMKVDGFKDSFSALEAFKQTPEKWDIIVSDISLPGIDGLEVVKRIKEMNHTLPVIMYSGFKRPNLEDKLEELGITKVLIKPVFPDVMMQEIRKAVRSRES